MQKEMVRAEGLPKDFRKGNVLVVDDDEFSRDLLSRRLQRAGYDVIATGDGRGVPDLLEKREFRSGSAGCRNAFGQRT